MGWKEAFWPLLIVVGVVLILFAIKDFLKFIPKSEKDKMTKAQALKIYFFGILPLLTVAIGFIVVGLFIRADMINNGDHADWREAVTTVFFIAAFILLVYAFRKLGDCFGKYKNLSSIYDKNKMENGVFIPFFVSFVFIFLGVVTIVMTNIYHDTYDQELVGIAYEEQGDYYKAYLAYLELRDDIGRGWGDLDERIENVKNPALYQKALEEESNGNYINALKLYFEVWDYNDSVERALHCIKLIAKEDMS